MSDRNPKYARQYERYDWLKQHGICVNCGQDYACVGSALCPECSERKYEKNREYHSTHPEEHKKRCREYNKRIYAERRAKGLCTKCGRKAIDGQTLCLECSVKRRKKKDPRWNNDIERSMRPELGLCYVCGKSLNKWDKLCDDCHEKYSEKMKKINANPTEAMLRAREEYAIRHRRFKEHLFCKKQNSYPAQLNGEKKKGEEK